MNLEEIYPDPGGVIQIWIWENLVQMEEMFGRIGQTNWATVSMYVLARFEAVSQEGDVKVDGEPPE